VADNVADIVDGFSLLESTIPGTSIEFLAKKRRYQLRLT
jgi:hypothetical protein